MITMQINENNTYKLMITIQINDNKYKLMITIQINDSNTN